MFTSAVTSYTQVYVQVAKVYSVADSARGAVILHFSASSEWQNTFQRYILAHGARKETVGN
jgi:hypothetical protein